MATTNTPKKKTGTSVPKGAKKPADRKAPTTSGPRQVDIRGVKVTLPEDALNDFELLEDLGELDKKNAARLPSILKRLAGDSYPKLLEKVRDKETGRVSIEAGGELVEELMEALDPNS